MPVRSDISDLGTLLETVFKVNDITVVERSVDPGDENTSEMVTYTCRWEKKIVIICMAEAKE